MASESTINPKSTALSKYFLGHHGGEISRLNQQHTFYKSMFDYPELVPPGVDITHVSRVIDVGTGTGAWVLDFVSLPSVRDRGLQVFACDISTAKFPRNDNPEGREITWFQQDVTKPFEDVLLGTFDLINLSFLSFALTAQGWKVALRNLYSLLKPGGHLLVREGDIITHNRENPPPSEGQQPNITASLQGTSNVANINRVFAVEALKRGHVVGLSYHLPRMLEETSFQVLSSQRVSVPFGNYCDFLKSRNGMGLSKYRAYTVWNYMQILDTISLAATKAGDLALADGTRIVDEEGRLALMEEIIWSLMMGGFMIVSDWVAVRPLADHHRIERWPRNKL